jgi:hypothetical protein
MKWGDSETARKLRMVITVRSSGRGVDTVGISWPTLFGRDSAGSHLVLLGSFGWTDSVIMSKAANDLAAEETAVLRDVLGIA